MPTTRAARAAARAAALQKLIELPADVLGLVLYQLPLAHDIALTGLTCRALCDAAKLAIKLRPFSGEVVTLAGHTSSVHALAVAPDGRVITGSWDRTLKVWRDGVCERTIHQAHTRDVDCVAMLPGGTRFVSGAGGGSVKVWMLDGGLETTVQFRADFVPTVAALPDGMHFVVGNRSEQGHGQVRLYHVDGTLIHDFLAHWYNTLGVAVTPDGQHIISCGASSDKLAKVWSIANKKDPEMVSICQGHTGTVWAVAAMPDGKRFLSGGEDRTVRVWLLDGTLKNTFMLHVAEVRALVALPDNQHALSASADGTVKLFNVNDGTVLRTFKHHTNFRVLSLALLPDGLRFVSGSVDSTARVVYHGLAPTKA